MSGARPDPREETMKRLASLAAVATIPAGLGLVALIAGCSTPVRGALDGPVEIERVMTPPPTAFRPRGTPETFEATGRVVEVEANGTVAVQAPQGRIVVWEATPSPFEFSPGDRVRVRISVQPLVPAPPGRAPA